MLANPEQEQKIGKENSRVDGRQEDGRGSELVMLINS
jgi:hypothetical protein